MSKDLYGYFLPFISVSLNIFPQGDPDPVLPGFVLDSVVDCLPEATDGKNIPFLQFCALVRHDSPVHKDFLRTEQLLRLATGKARKCGNHRVQSFRSHIQPDRIIPGLQLRKIRICFRSAHGGSAYLGQGRRDQLRGRNQAEEPGLPVTDQDVPDQASLNAQSQNRTEIIPVGQLLRVFQAFWRNGDRADG